MNILPAGLTALPNIHPAIVHFPVALLLVALAFDVSCILARRYMWLDRAAAALYLLGAIGAGGAYLTGRLAEDSLTEVSPQVQPLIAQHADWALRTVLFFAVVAGVRLAVVWRDRRADRIQLKPTRLVVFLLALAGPWFVFQTADRGGLLVYQHGLAVAAGGHGTSGSPPAPPPDATAPTAPTSTSRLERASDGALRWQPVSGDRGAVGRDLTPARRSPLDAVQVTASANAGDGIELAVSRRALLVLPGSFGDVEVAAELDIERFQGTVGLAHHVRSGDDAEVFVVSNGGDVALKRLGGAAAATTRDSGHVTLPRGAVKLAVSSASTHFKGTIAGRTVVHGHGSPADGDGVGLLLDGVGIVRVRWMQVTPLTER